ncbi:M14 family zinc carboxypeptidase [Stomatobaculum sp. F0698]|uniref:M14 family zinc carboxypeptidase n=1 Tax=Stomatobaculum sp. F0698 TaxID=3059030 RepID=UPI002729D9D4|nr:M14 family zinc carboxypeptidase [Stomatobaculum sp. F0698]WLD87337.1 M14 family zinc carboxypeptidase [Stomatobaculum sp. F0698]
MRRKLWLLLCALGVLGMAACGAGESKANAAAKTKVVKSSAAAKTSAESKTNESESAATAKAAASDSAEAATEPAMPASTAAGTAEATLGIIQSGDYLCFQSSLYTYGEFQRDMVVLQKNAGAALRVDEIGQTVDGNRLYDFRVGNPAAERHLLVFGGIHAREYITAQLVMRQLVQLLSDQSANGSYENMAVRELLSNTEIHFIPMANPDGIGISQLGIEGLRTEAVRETVRQIASKDGKALTEAYLRQWKSNANGVDLNRNFDALWESYNDHLGHASADHYKGTAPECELESKALADLTRQFQFDATLSYHTQGEVIYWNFGQEGELKDMSLLLANRVSELTGYRLDGNFQALDTAGYKDWAISKMGIPSLTIEAGHGGNPVDPAQMDAIWRENRNVVPMTLKLLKEGQLRRVR